MTPFQPEKMSRSLPIGVSLSSKSSVPKKQSSEYSIRVPRRDVVHSSGFILQIKCQVQLQTNTNFEFLMRGRNCSLLLLYITAVNLCSQISFSSSSSMQVRVRGRVCDGSHDKCWTMVCLGVSGKQQPASYHSTYRSMLQDADGSPSFELGRCP